MTRMHVPLEYIDPNPFQCRREYGDIAGLAADIKGRGLLQVPRGRLVHGSDPVLGDSVLNLQPKKIWEGGYRVQLVYGHRRLRAFRLLRETVGITWRSMPVDILPSTDDDMLDDMWSENTKRADFDLIEQAEMLAAKLERVKANGGTQETLAREWGIDRSTLANRVRLLKLPEGVQMGIRAGLISERKALAMLPAVNGDGFGEIVDRVGELSSGEIRDEVRRQKRPRAGLTMGDPIPMLVHGGVDVVQLEESEFGRAVRYGAWRACKRCIEVVGPAVELVCKECPAVTLVRSIKGRLYG